MKFLVTLNYRYATRMPVRMTRNYWWFGTLLACSAACAQGGPPFAADLNEAVIEIPVLVNGQPTESHMVGTLFKPDGDGPFPFAIISHGRAGMPVERAQVPRWRYSEQSRWLVRKGFAVIVPTRRGYGATGGSDVEQSYNCANPAYRDALAGGVESVLSAISYAKAQKFIDPARFILIGQSVGGFLTVGVTATAPPGLVAAVNFAGGHGGDPMRHPVVPCAPEKLLEVYSAAGRTARVPMLWVYTENDQYFGPEYVRSWHAGFNAAGGHAELHVLPPFQNDGHRLFVNGMAIWQPVVETFLRSVGF